MRKKLRRGHVKNNVPEVPNVPNASDVSDVSEVSKIPEVPEARSLYTTSGGTSIP